MSTVDHTNNGSPTIVVGWDGSAATRGAIAAAARIAEALLRAAHDHHADAIAVGSRGIGATSADAGSVSAELLRTADVPILVIPPPSTTSRKPEPPCTSRPPIRTS